MTTRPHHRPAFVVVAVAFAAASLAARGGSPAAFDGRSIPALGVAPRSNIPDSLPPRAWIAGRLARLGATRHFHHGLPGLVHAAAPSAGVATGTIRGTVTLPASAAGRRPSVSRPGGTSAADRQQDALDRQTSVLYLDNMPRGMAGEFVERRARLDQRGERFVPHIVAIGVGGSVDFPNSDPTFHNVFSLSDVRSFDLGRYATGRSKTVRFDKPGVVRVFCDIHAHMSAFIFVFAHPYFDVTDGQGRYRIDGVPAGTHALVLWNETIEPETRQVTVPDGGEVEVNFTLGAPPAPK